MRRRSSRQEAEALGAPQRRAEFADAGAGRAGAGARRGRRAETEPAASRPRTGFEPEPEPASPRTSPARPARRSSHADSSPSPSRIEPVGPPEGEDVLEETPDFLQETPEHDRLWFEQKPPRDFDLDR